MDMLFFIRESRTENISMNLKPQDILLLLKLIALGRKPWSFNKLAIELGMSPSEVHAAAKRALAARLAVKVGDNIRPNMRNLEDFLSHGIQYVFVPERGELNRGIPTAYAAEPMSSYIAAGNEPPPVWPDPDGEVRGMSFSPLYKSVPKAAKKDSKLYELLVLVDSIRGGQAREHDIAVKELVKLLRRQTKEKNVVQKRNQKKLVIGGKIEISLSDLQELAKRFHIRRLYLFGSAARGELRPDSDIDLLIEFKSKGVPSMGGMVEIQDAFTKLFHGRKVDISTPSILNNPYRKQTIEKDMEELYAA